MVSEVGYVHTQEFDLRFLFPMLCCVHLHVHTCVNPFSGFSPKLVFIRLSLCSGLAWVREERGDSAALSVFVHTCVCCRREAESGLVCVCKYKAPKGGTGERKERGLPC